MTAITCSYIGDHAYVAQLAGKNIARLLMDDAHNCVAYVSVDKAYRSQGIALRLCRFARQHRGKPLSAPQQFANSAARRLDRYRIRAAQETRR